ncbi:MAG: SpoIID/LytB domain-containing protein [Ignavibacteriaceae bacterium]
MEKYSSEPQIKVGIISDSEINFDLYGDFEFNGKKFSGIFSAQIINNRIICKKGKDIIAEADEVFFNTKDPTGDSFLIHDVTIGVKFHWERKEEQRFLGSLKLIKEKGKITAINVIPIEAYLISVVSSEMSARSSMQLLKAHAIVSRSWLLSQIEKSKSLQKQKITYNTSFENESELIKWYDREDHKNFDVCADDHCQRYQGITKVFTDVARRAVRETKGIIISFEDKICDARYSKSCGGVTESFENVWEPIKYEYLSSIVDYKFEPDNFSLDFTKEENAAKWIKSNPPAYCNTTDKKILAQILLDFDQETTDFFRWKIEYAQNELSQLIKEKSQVDFGEILDLVPIERGASSRLIKLKIIGTKKILTIGKELEIRRILSPSHLYSSAIVVEKKDIKNKVPQKFIISGAGWGHGVGLCQIGAAVMAAKGYNFDEILLHYFSNARLVQLYSS